MKVCVGLERLSETWREGAGQHGNTDILSSQRAVLGSVLEVTATDLKEAKTWRERLRWLVGHPHGQEVIPVMVGVRRKESCGLQPSFK